MTKEPVLHIMVTAMFLVASVALGLLPGVAGAVAARFLPALFSAVLVSILCGPFYGTLLGVLSPLLLWILFQETPFVRSIPAEILFSAFAGLTSGILYTVLRTGLGATLAGILSGTVIYGLAQVFTALAEGVTYDLAVFGKEAFLTVWPGLLLTAAAVPLLIVWFRRVGVMRVMRHERMI